MIDIIVNGQTHFLFTEERAREVMRAVIPDFFMDSSLPAPDPVSDIVRGGLKGIAVMPTGLGKPNVFQALMFEVYGGNAAKIEKRADKLPHIWRAIMDYLIRKSTDRNIEIEVTSSGEGVYIVESVRAVAIHGRTAPEHLQ